MTTQFFVNADRYLRALEQTRASSIQVREDRSAYPAFTERHLQCIWYDPRFRPHLLTTADGEQVIVESPGIWNLEAGPDFIGAVLSIGTQRRVAGDVEIHINPSDWKNHGHHKDCRYDQVRIHVTYASKKVATNLFPPGTIHIALQEGLSQLPGFSFDHIDTAAYPYSTPGESPRCRSALARIPSQTCGALLDAAGEERIRRKTMRMKDDIITDGQEQVLYRSIFSALGYKNNKAPFRALAELVPENRLRAQAENDSLKAYAILLGVSGLIPEDLQVSWSDSSRDFIRNIWDYWWRVRDQWPTQVTDKCKWDLSGIRPANHPMRRLMAAACLFTTPQPLTQRIEKLRTQNIKQLMHQLTALLIAPADNWWTYHLSLNSPRSTKPTAILGNSRANAIMMNVFIPYLIATKPMTTDQNLIHLLPRESTNAIVKQMAHTLFGSDSSPTLYRSPLRQQGLLQIFNDFCLNDRSRCQACKLPELADLFAES